jgi:uncharacterized UPF0146 family protein
MATPTEQIANQNEEYRESLLQDIKAQNERVIEMMDNTVAYREREESEARLQAMNSFSPQQRRRLMAGEKLEDLLPPEITNKSKYYNTSEEAVKAIGPNKLFVYQIGDHLMAYETHEVNVNEQLKTIGLSVVVFNVEEDDYEEKVYTICDPDVFNILQYQLGKHKAPVIQYDSPSSSEHEHDHRGIQDVPFDFEKEQFDRSYDSSPDPFHPTGAYDDTHTHTHGHREILYNEPEPEYLNIDQLKQLTGGGDISTNRADETVRKIQDKLFEQLLSIYGGESAYSAEVYTSDMEARIQRMLARNRLPFQIVNDILVEFTS